MLRIFKTPKAVDAPAKVTKLAIGKPGGIDPETDRWETSVKVYCHACDVYLDHTNPQIAPLVDSVLLAQSASEQSAVAEWELEVQPCEHTLTLDQSTAQMIAQKSLASFTPPRVFSGNRNLRTSPKIQRHFISDIIIALTKYLQARQIVSPKFSNCILISWGFTYSYVKPILVDKR